MASDNQIKKYMQYFIVAGMMWLLFNDEVEEFSYDGDFEMIAWTLIGVIIIGGYLYFEWYFKKPKN